MKICCFTMMKNESAILDPFLDQVAAFFDYAAVVDHGSTDDSAEKVRARAKSNIALFTLKATGYPQAEVASFFGHRIFEQEHPDFLFFLDCDEFLPFRDRAELERFLANKQKYDCLRVCWRNIAPLSFDGGNIFAGSGFNYGSTKSTVPKVILSESLHRRNPKWALSQGYHGLMGSEADPLRIFDITDRWLYHIPIQSRTQFMFKLAVGSQVLLSEKQLLKNGQGYHWVDLADEVERRQLSDRELRMLALEYPDKTTTADPSISPVDFTFPYVRSVYTETASYFSGHIRELMRLMRRPPFERKGAFTLVDQSGQIIAVRETSAEQTCVDSGQAASVQIQGPPPCPLYFDLIEPLFNLPTKLPISAWDGHIPFIFVLFRAMRPATYVELGVHTGASLIAASTAAAAYNLNSRLFGVDTWEGDVHAGFYDGDVVYSELRTYVEAIFPRTKLNRCLFSDAVAQFAPESVDILHIDGLHTYDAVKNDFMTWLDRLSPTGVILFHDISICDRGFGVYQLWAELKTNFVTLEFHHSAGLGVLFMDPNAPGFAPLITLSKDAEKWATYQKLVATIADTLRERMAAYEPSPAPNTDHVVGPSASANKGKVRGLEKMRREIRRVIGKL